jgi:hypothetical protein
MLKQLMTSLSLKGKASLNTTKDGPMTKTFLSLFLIFFVFACNKKEDCSTTASADGSTPSTCSTPDTSTPGQDGSGTGTGTDTGTGSGDTTTPPPTDVPTDVPSAALTFGFNVVVTGMTAAQQAKIDAAKALIKKVIGSSEFRTRVLNFTYNGKKAFVDNGGYTNEQIYQKILDGAEELYPTKNNTMDLEVELYYASTNTIGYTYANVTKIWMNTKYFNNYTAVEVSDNLTHEWLHKVGFDHASSYSVSRDSSVPYAIGYLVEELAAKLK